MKRSVFLLSAVISCLLPAQADEPREELVSIPEGKEEVSIKGSLKGSNILDYQIDAKAGQTLGVSLTSNRSTQYFNLLPPENGKALFVGSMSASDKQEVSKELTESGRYTIRLYLMGNARDAGLTAQHSLKVSLTGAKANIPKKLSLQGITFTFETEPAIGSGTTVTITPEGLEKDNKPIQKVVSGKVSNIEIADLDANGSPEIYIYSVSGKDKKSHLTAYAANNKKSLSQIYLPPLEEDKENAAGYAGHDEFAVVENILARRFPIQKDGKASGKTRQIQYKLHPGEAGWLLKVDKVTEY